MLATGVGGEVPDVREEEDLGTTIGELIRS